MARGVVVLVHGAWHGSWVWEKVRPLLEAEGVRVVTPDLPSCGARAGEAGLREDADLLAALASDLPAPVVVCAHSYGGMVASEADLGGNVRRLVYLCAFLPEVGAPLVSHFESVPSYAQIRGDGTVAFDLDQAPGVLYNDLPAGEAARAAARLVLHGAPAVTTPTTRASWREIPATYVVCERDNTLPPAMQRAFAAKVDRAVSLDASHSPMLSQPERVAALLLDALRA